MNLWVAYDLASPSCLNYDFTTADHNAPLPPSHLKSNPFATRQNNGIIFYYFYLFWFLYMFFIYFNKYSTTVVVMMIKAAAMTMFWK